jgi:peptidoglycan/LPS O-acetylase OafA/YrhL
MLRNAKPSDDVPVAADVALTVQDSAEPLVSRDDSDDKKDKKPAPKAAAKAAAPPPTKVLFLDGVRGVAALMVCTSHSKEYMADIDLGAIAVDAFFVLSSFLLTWLFMTKCTRLLAQGASMRKWGFTLADYFSKRFCRVYPLFAITSVVIWCLPAEAKKRYYLIKQPEDFDLYKVLTFEFDYRYFVFWTLPLEITFYFFIPVFVLGVLALRRFWFVPFFPAYYWVLTEGWYEFRTSHMELRPHLPTFVAGSLAAVIFVKLDTWLKTSGFVLRKRHVFAVRVVEYMTVAVFLSTTFHGLFFHWVHENPAPKAKGFSFISVPLTLLFVIEMILPSCVSGIFEWSVLRYWGKISFSVYLLHSFVLYARVVGAQSNWYDKVFSRFALILLLSTTSYHLIEYPSQLLSQRITKALAEQEKKGSGGMSACLGGWTSPGRVLASRLAWAQEA